MREPYTPAEDSFLMAQCLARAASHLPPKARALDMGTGTGFLASQLLPLLRDGKVVAADISSRAVAYARAHLPEEVEVVESNLFSSIRGTFHLILFNPPYLQREQGEAYDEAIHDEGVLERFIWEVGGYLEKGGLFLLLLSDAHPRFPALRELLFSLYNCRLCSKRGVGFETLYVYACTHPFAPHPFGEG